MKYAVICSFVLRLLLGVCLWSLNISRIESVEDVEFTQVEHDLMKNILEDSTPKKNAVFFTNINMACSNHTCERYSFDHIEDSLARRGKLLDVDRDDPMEPYPTLEAFRIQNAGLSEHDVFILKFKSLDWTEVRILHGINRVKEGGE